METIIIVGDFSIPIDKTLRLVLVVMDKVYHIGYIVYIACPFDPRIVVKECVNVGIFNYHKYEITWL